MVVVQEEAEGPLPGGVLPAAMRGTKDPGRLKSCLFTEYASMLGEE